MVELAPRQGRVRGKFIVVVPDCGASLPWGV